MHSHHASGEGHDSKGKSDLMKQVSANRSQQNNALRQNLTNEMLQELEETFASAAEGNTVLPSGRLSLAIKALGISINEVDQSLLTGEVDFEKFLEIVLSGMQLPNWAAREMSESYALFDKDGTGNIGTGELRSVFVRLGENLLETELQDQLREFDIDGDLMMAVSEYYKMVGSTRGIDFSFEDSTF